MLLKKWVLVVFVVMIVQYSSGMTREQLKKTLSLMKKSCMQKNNVNEDKIGKIEQGEWHDEKNVRCYVACIYKSVQVVKDDRLNPEMVMKQVDVLYPEEMRAPTKVAIRACMPLQENYNDVCSRVYYAAKCLYDTDPANFVFP